MKERRRQNQMSRDSIVSALMRLTRERTKEMIYARLDNNGIQYHMQTHGAVHSLADVDQAGVIREGIVLKNLFLKDGKGKKHFLLCIPEDRHTDFKEIGEKVRAKNLASPRKRDCSVSSA